MICTSYGITFKSYIPVTCKVLHSTYPSPKMGERFGQHLEPSGLYCILRPPLDDNLPAFPWWATQITMRQPLVMEFGGGYEEDTNWKKVLYRQYGKTGNDLTTAMREENFDGIVTCHSDSEVAEIVYLLVRSLNYDG